MRGVPDWRGLRRAESGYHDAAGAHRLLAGVGALGRGARVPSATRVRRRHELDLADDPPWRLAVRRGAPWGALRAMRRHVVPDEARVPAMPGRRAGAAHDHLPVQRSAHRVPAALLLHLHPRGARAACTHSSDDAAAQARERQRRRPSLAALRQPLAAYLRVPPAAVGGEAAAAAADQRPSHPLDAAQDLCEPCPGARRVHALLEGDVHAPRPSHEPPPRPPPDLYLARLPPPTRR